MIKAGNKGQCYCNEKQAAEPSLETQNSKSHWQKENLAIEEPHNDGEVQEKRKETENKAGKHSPTHSMEQEDKEGEGDNAKLHNMEDKLAQYKGISTVHTAKRVKVCLSMDQTTRGKP